jgi:murein DD-endopeptidase MepM/ murein hydrolase activator NlpD
VKIIPKQSGNKKDSHQAKKKETGQLKSNVAKGKSDAGFLFPLPFKEIGGYGFGQKTWYSKHHLGVDYKAPMDTKLVAPSGGTVTKSYGPEGGLTITFRPDNSPLVFRFMHLDKVTKVGHVHKGERIGLTGNSGRFTTGSHLHMDISKGHVDIRNFQNFVNPETIKWQFPIRLASQRK